jgi:hypothetical protein
MAPTVTRLSYYPVDRRVPHGAFSRLEPCAMKVASTVLRGRGDGNVTLLPDGSDPLFPIRRHDSPAGASASPTLS